MYLVLTVSLPIWSFLFQWAPALSDLMAKLNVEMSKTESKDKSLPYNKKFLVKNRYCVAKSGNDGVWYRAQIVEMLKTGVELV